MIKKSTVMRFYFRSKVAKHDFVVYNIVTESGRAQDRLIKVEFY